MLKRSWEAAESAREPVTHHKKEVEAYVPPTKQRRKFMEEKALVGAIVTDHVKARTRRRKGSGIEVDNPANDASDMTADCQQGHLHPG